MSLFSVYITLIKFKIRIFIMNRNNAIHYHLKHYSRLPLPEIKVIWMTRVWSKTFGPGDVGDIVMLMIKKVCWWHVLHLSYIPIGHQHPYSPESDAGDWYWMLVRWLAIKIRNVSPTYSVSNIRHQYQWSHFGQKRLVKIIVWLTAVLSFWIWEFENLEQKRLKGIDIVFSLTKSQNPEVNFQDFRIYLLDFYEQSDQIHQFHRNLR